MNVLRTETFLKNIKRLDSSFKAELLKAVDGVVENPFKGKPLKYFSKLFSERVRNFRLIYRFEEGKNEILLVCFKNRDEVYDFLRQTRWNDF